MVATFDAHRQRRLYQREAGGQLFARVWDDEWEIVSATGPRSRDRRGRFSFWPHRASEQEESRNSVCRSDNETMAGSTT
ncbi:MAG: hypothetical protein WCA28_26485 [Bradyrhizobium sp.]